MACLCHFHWIHVYIICLAMGVFTTSWWVVNQPIVVVILLCFRRFKNTFVSYHWWCDTLCYYDYHFFTALCIAGRCPVFSYSWVWHPRDYVREAYKRIGHAEISNF